MKLTKILEEVITEIGDLSAGSFPFTSKASSIRTAAKKLISQLPQEIEVWREVNKKRGHEFDPTEITVKSSTTYPVTGDSGINYNIKISYAIANEPKDKSDFSSGAQVDFNIKGGDRNNITSTNANEQYKLISTLVSVFIDFANSIEPLAPLTAIAIFPIVEKGEKANSLSPLDSKRAKLYKIYINKNLDKLPGDWSIEEGSSRGAIILKRK